MNQLLDRLKSDFQNEDARYEYADSVVNAFVSAQIKELREDRDLSQGKLAELIGTKQSGVSRLERSDYSSWKVETLRKLARAFGVRLRLGFEEFGTILDDVAGFEPKDLLPRRFEDDPVFQGLGHKAHRKFRSCAKERGVRKRRHSQPGASTVAKRVPILEQNAYPAVSPPSGNSTNLMMPAMVSGNQSGVNYGN